MTARFNRRWAVASRANLALALSLLTAGSALAHPGRRSSEGPARPTSIVSVPARSRTCAQCPKIKDDCAR